MRAVWTEAYYFTMVKDNETTSCCAGVSVQASNYCVKIYYKMTQKYTHKKVKWWLPTQRGRA